MAEHYQNPTASRYATIGAAALMGVATAFAPNASAQNVQLAGLETISTDPSTFIPPNTTGLSPIRTVDLDMIAEISGNDTVARQYSQGFITLSVRNRSGEEVTYGWAVDANKDGAYNSSDRIVIDTTGRGNYQTITFGSDITTTSWLSNYHGTG